jgi:hypothetical protein
VLDVLSDDFDELDVVSDDFDELDVSDDVDVDEPESPFDEGVVDDVDDVVAELAFPRLSVL